MKHSIRWAYDNEARQWQEGISVLIQCRGKRPPMMLSHFRPDWVGSDHYGRGSRYARLVDLMNEPFASE